MLSNVELISRLVLAAALGSVIGFERERLSWAAGLRTLETVREFKGGGPALDRARPWPRRASMRQCGLENPCSRFSVARRQAGTLHRACI